MCGSFQMIPGWLNNFANTLQSARGDSALFPSLRVLHFMRVDVRGIYQLIFDTFNDRPGRLAQLHITLERCFSVVQTEVETLKQIVSVDWDGVSPVAGPYDDVREPLLRTVADHGRRVRTVVVDI